MNTRYTTMLSRGFPALLAGLLIGQGAAYAARYKMLYAFQAGADGAQPAGRLAELGTKLFGVTSLGGAPCGCGTVFQLSAAGAEHVIYSFAGSPSDGAYPLGGLAVVGTALYGTTSGGGLNTCEEESECGTVFSITPNGLEKVIHNFQNGEAFSPQGDLLAFGDAVWGTSPMGLNGGGGVFKTRLSGITKSYELQAGYDLTSGLIRVKGVFYGTSFSGGFNCGFEEFCGTVFEMTPNGQNSPVYEFQGGVEGSYPNGSLIYSHGFLYGTTIGQMEPDSGYGSVFRLSPSGTETMLYSFGGGDDGATPYAGLTELDHIFFGTTQAGGGTGCGGHGCGTIFSIRPDGTYKVQHRFQGGSDGQVPQSQLVVWNGALYGTTSYGGGGPCTNEFYGVGCGTVFRLHPY